MYKDGDVANMYDISNDKDWTLVHENNYLKSKTFYNFKLELTVTFYGNGYVTGTVERLE